MAILWPVAVLSPQRFSFDIAPRSLAGPSSVSGVGQVTASDAGIWKASFQDIFVRKRKEPVLAFRAISTILEGRLHPILVPVCHAYQPYAEGSLSALKGVPHSDRSPFSDGGLYRSRLIDIRLTSNISLRGTTANVSIIVGANLQPGQHFSIRDRLYRIRTVQMTGENAATITFRPPAREPVSAGTELEFDRPVCRMRLASDSEMDLVMFHQNPSVNFIEDV